MQILTPRKYELTLYKIISDIDPKAFIMSYEPTQIHGGFWVKQIRKGKLTNVPPENPIIQSEIDKEFTKQEENEK